MLVVISPIQVLMVAKEYTLKVILLLQVLEAEVYMFVVISQLQVLWVTV